MPTLESPNHDHAHYEQTMKWYYPFLPFFPNRLTAWKKQPKRIDLASSGGHVVSFQGIKQHAVSFPMRHYIFLSLDHALEKYIGKEYDSEEINAGWHRWRSGLTEDMLRLPSQSELRPYHLDETLDASSPRQRHFLAEVWAKAKACQQQQ